MKYENANPWFCSKCSPSLAGKLWSRKFNVLLKGQIFWQICSVFPAIFAAILLLNVGRMCNYGNYIILMTFYEQKNCLLPFLALIKRNFCLMDRRRNINIFDYFHLWKPVLCHINLYAWNTIAQWENVLVVDGQQFAQIANYFTFWKNLFFVNISLKTLLFWNL